MSLVDALDSTVSSRLHTTIRFFLIAAGLIAWSAVWASLFHTAEKNDWAWLTMTGMGLVVLVFAASYVMSSGWLLALGLIAVVAGFVGMAAQ